MIGGASNARPAHLLAETLAALFNVAFTHSRLPPSPTAGLLRRSLRSYKRETPPSHPTTGLNFCHIPKTE